MTDLPSDAEVVASPAAMVTGASGHIGGALLHLLTAAGDRTIGVDQPGSRPGPSTGVLRLDLVVAGAGVTALGDLDSTTDATFRQVMDVNYHGALRTTRAALPALRRARGHLVVISSVAGLVPVPGRPAYVGAKHALTGVFLSLAGELARDGVAVTVVHPAFLRTSVTEVGASAPRSTTGAAMDADDVARAIMRLVARRRSGRRVPDRVMIGHTALLADAVARIAPELARRLAVRRLRR